MADWKSLAEKSVEKGEFTELVVQKKFELGKIFIDLRMRLNYPNQNGVKCFSSKKGICLSADEWKKMIPIIQEFLNQKE